MGSRAELAQAQEAKQTLLVQGRPIIMEQTQAALAFGISRGNLQRMARLSRSLVITPLEGETVRIELKALADAEQKNLWEEMIKSLERGRSEVDLNKVAYMALAVKLQYGLSTNWEEDSDLMQLALFTLWDQLPLATKRGMEAINPSNLRSAVGISGSGE